ncbi:unnamed protein product [Lactuca virosa]|uniref:Ribosomal RNA-processing protein 12-like conserved domain-containing protein n=1 Tax=Lactuca virosa TaxID=75947 RepID=A0AAU9P6D5_9ASTR|nr:unnamed protein product [Lactuca virosa]
MKKQRQQSTEGSMEESTDATTSFTGESDICQQLLDRYGKSAASQHRHLCATAAATRSIIQSESLPLTPLSYFAATIDALSDTSKTTQDADAVSALSSFLAIVLPLVPEKSIATSKAAEAVEIVVELVDNPCEGLPVSSVRALVKCLGVLLDFCDLDDWKSVQLGFQTLMKYSIDKRPKVRKCAQDCVVKVFKSFQSSLVKKSASKLFLKSFKTYMSLAVETVSSRSTDGSKDDKFSKCEQLEALHMLNLLKFLVPCLPSKEISKTVVELQKSISAKFSPLTRHVFDVMEEILRLLEDESTIPDTLEIVTTLASYISTKQNPVDTLFSAAALLENFLTKFQVGDANKWNSHYSLVIGSIAGLLTSEATATKASNILKEMINRHIDVDILTDENNVESKESRIVKSLCDALLKILSTHKGTPNEHTLAVISLLFLKLGKISHIYMENILLKLASFMTLASGNPSDVKHLQQCIGSAVVAIGPDKLLAVLPISLDASDLTCSNTWLIPILKEYVNGSSLGFFIESIVPIAESFQEACQKVKKSAIREQLQSHARGCWGLLPAFCCYPNDTYKKFGSLAKLLIPHIKKDAIMLEYIAIALQHLVKQNRSFLGDDEASKLPKISYSKKTATKNIKALSSWSEGSLKAFTKVLFRVPFEKRAFVKDTIKCLASITEPSTIKAVFVSSLKRIEVDVSGDDAKDDKSSSKKNANKCLILELASSVVGTASMDLIDLIYSFIKESLKEEDDHIQREAYATLYKILEESSEFRSSKFEELMDLLLGLKSPVDITSLRWRFSCFKNLLIHSIEITSDGENTYGFRMLNEIIVTLKDSKEESRKVAYDILIGMSCTLQKTPSSLQKEKGPYYEFVTMIMGYLSGSSPHIKSGAVSALSLVIYNDSKICKLMPDLVPSILELLHSKAIEVIKAVLGFIKVLVLSLEGKDLASLLSDILSGLLPWSSVSRHHFKSKVTVILEIMMRKCGSASVKSLVPEKYRDFVKDVLENREGKKSSQEGVTTKTDHESSDTTPNSGEKRKPNEAYSRESGKRKREDKHSSSSYGARKFSRGGKDVDSSKKQVKHFGQAKSMDRKSQGTKRKTTTSLKKDTSSSSGAKKQKQWTRKGNKKNAPVT